MFSVDHREVEVDDTRHSGRDVSECERGTEVRARPRERHAGGTKTSSASICHLSCNVPGYLLHHLIFAVLVNVYTYTCLI